MIAMGKRIKSPERMLFYSGFSRMTMLTQSLPPDTQPAVPIFRAQVAELVDALASGASVRKVVEVRVLSWAPLPFDRTGMPSGLSGTLHMHSLLPL